VKNGCARNGKVPINIPRAKAGTQNDKAESTTRLTWITKNTKAEENAKKKKEYFVPQKVMKEDKTKAPLAAPTGKNW
jgi:hypothetical protein